MQVRSARWLLTNAILNPHTTRWQGNESSVTTGGRQYGRRQTFVILWFRVYWSLRPKFFAERRMIEVSRERVREDRAWLSPPDTSTNQNIASDAQHKGSATWFFEGNTCMEWKSKPTTSLLWIHGKRMPFSFVSYQILISSKRYSGFGEEHPMVCDHLSGSPPRNLSCQLAPQSSKT